MPRPENLKTRIFLDSADPLETEKIKEKLGFIDGQTTNPTLISKTPEIKTRFDRGERFTEAEIWDLYQDIIEEIDYHLGFDFDKSVSIEVYADKTTDVEDLLTQASKLNTWVDNAHIKFPTTKNGLTAAKSWVNQGHRANMTLGFSLEQAAAVYSATRKAEKGQVFFSSFVGRFFDAGINGITHLKNVQKLLSKGNGHVELLVCSFRSYEQFLAALALEVDIITASYSLLERWANDKFRIPEPDFNFNFSKTLLEPPYKDLDIEAPFDSFEIDHPMALIGITQFVQDWCKLLDDDGKKKHNIAL